MTDYTLRDRLTKQVAGTNINLWGDVLNTALDLVDYSLDGWASFDPTGNHTVTSANGTTTGNEASSRTLKLTTAVATFITTLPGLEHWYIVWNATTAPQTIASSGGGSTVNIGVGEVVFIACDAMNVKRLTLSTMTAALDMGSHKITSVSDPTNPQDAATKNYADNLAFAANAGILPGQIGNAGKYLKTDGAAASWQQPSTADLSDYTSDQAAKTTAQHAFAVAMAVAL